MSLRNSLRVRGMSGTLELAWRRIFNSKKTPTYILSRMVDLGRYDREHNVETAGLIELTELRFESTSKAEGTRYGGASPSVFREAIDRLQIDFEKYTFIDIGSGKGAALFHASDFPFKQIVGVEFAPELHAVALRNIANFRSKTQKCQRITTICGDGAAYSYPEGPWVLFFNCPFGPSIWKQVAENLQRAQYGFPGSYLIHIQAGFRVGAKQFVASLPFLKPSFEDDMVDIFTFVS